MLNSPPTPSLQAPPPVQEYVLVVDTNSRTAHHLVAICEQRLFLQTRFVPPHMPADSLRELPTLAFIAVDGDPTAAIEFLRQLHHLSPVTAVIVYGPSESATSVAQAMNLGARYFLVAPFEETDVLTALDTVWHELQQLSSVASVHTASMRRGKLIPVFSPKGGSGSTTLAVNMAAGFRQQGYRTAILDCNLNFGNVGIFYGITPEKTLSDCIPSSAATSALIDRADILRSIVHHESGVDLLLAPLRPEEGERVTKEHLQQITAVLQRTYDRILVDTWTSYDDRVIEFLDRGDAIIVPITPELPAMRNLGALRRVIKAVGIPMEKFRWVLVRANTVAESDIEDMERFLSLTIHHRIISDGRLVVSSTREGKPFVLSHPDVQASRDVMAICQSVNVYLADLTPRSVVGGAETTELTTSNRQLFEKVRGFFPGRSLAGRSAQGRRS